MFGCEAIDDVNYLVLAALTEPIRGTPRYDLKMIKLHTIGIKHYIHSYRIDYKPEIGPGLHTDGQKAAL